MTIEEIIKTLESLQQRYANMAAILSPGAQSRAHYRDGAAALKEGIALLKSRPDAQPNEPLTLEEMRGMDGQPVWGADGKCYIINLENDYAADKYRGFRMLWTRDFFYRRPPKED